MPIKHDDDQVVVHCTGDILVLPFSPKQEPCNGVAWLLLQEREGGEIGRDQPEGQDSFMCINGQPGVLIAADDYRSLDVIIDALSCLRNELAMIEVEKKRRSGKVPRRVELYHGVPRNGDAPIFVSGLDLDTIETQEVKGRGTIHICIWPEDVEPFNINRKIVMLDGKLHEVCSVESMGGIRRGESFAITVRPFDNM